MAIYLPVLFSAILLHACTVESSTYVRWGRTTCPPSAMIVYTGIIGSAWADAFSSMLCLADNAQFDNPTAGRQVGGVLVGAEYNLPSAYVDGKPFSFQNNNGASLHSVNAPCVVCAVTSSNVIMVPSRKECPTDYMAFEYRGFLSTGKGYREAICVDKAPEGIAGTSGDSTSSDIGPIEAACDNAGIPCPPYQDGYEVTCVVCSFNL